MKKRVKRIIEMKVLPGEPLDGSGRVCIHLFVPDEAGTFTEPHVLHPVYENGVRVKQRLEARETRGRLACDPKRDPSPKTVTLRTGGSFIIITPRTDNPQAVNCPKCLASKDYTELLQKYESADPAQ